MDEPKSLDSLFKEKIFRIPDYQRGYAWQREQLKAFWEDLVNLSDRPAFPSFATHSPLTPMATSGRGTEARALPVSAEF